MCTCLQNASVIGQKPFGMDCFSVAGIAKHRRGWVRATKRRITTPIGPKAPDIGAARRQYRHNRFIAMQPVGRQCMRIKVRLGGLLRGLTV
jgi:hypothetical protein